MVPRNLTRSYSVVQFLTSKGIAVKPQPPYSPNLAPYDFLFQKAKSARKTPFWINRRHPEVCNAGLKWHSSTCIPGMLQTVAAPLENVWAGTRHALWRWPYFSWWINKIKLFFFWNQSHYSTVRPCMQEIAVNWTMKTSVGGYHI